MSCFCFPLSFQFCYLFFFLVSNSPLITDPLPALVCFLMLCLSVPPWCASPVSMYPYLPPVCTLCAPFSPCQFVFALRSKRASSHPSVCPLVLLTMFFWTLPCLCQAPLCFMLPCCLISCVLNQPSVDAVFFGKPELAIAQVVDLSQCVGIWQAGSRYTLQHFRPMKQKC